jgi:methyl-accepting chemotaxis protein
MNAGRVELDLVAIARDQVSATLREINGKLRETKGEMDKAAGANQSLNASTKKLGDNMREGAKPLNNMREGFENLRSNGLFLVSAITAVGGVLVGLVKHLSEAGTAQGELNARTKEFGEAGDDMQRAIESLRDKLGQMGDKTREAFDKGTIAASEMRLKLDLTDEAMGDAAVKAQKLRYEWETFDKYQFAGSGMEDRAVKANAVERAERRVLDLANERRALAGKIAEFENLTLE